MRERETVDLVHFYDFIELRGAYTNIGWKLSKLMEVRAVDETTQSKEVKGC